MIYYLPSCKYQAAHPDSSRKLQRWLCARGDIQIAGCCRTSQHLFQSGDVVLTNCTSCSAITREVSPAVKEMSIYEFLLRIPDFDWPDYQGEVITVQDCYRSRHDLQMMKAVRECLRRMNMVPVELEAHLEQTRFDGVFQFSGVSENNLTLAPDFFGKIQRDYVEEIPPDEQVLRMKQWVSQYTTRRTAAYCNACLKGIQLGGAEGVHLLELITRELTDAADRPVSSVAS